MFMILLIAYVSGSLDEQMNFLTQSNTKAKSVWLKTTSAPITTKNEHKWFICLLQKQKRISSEYRFTPIFIYSELFLFISFFVHICFFSHCTESNWSKALGILYFFIWRYTFTSYTCGFFLVPPKSTIHIWFHNAFCAHHIIFIHFASYLNLLEYCVYHSA